jgi:hypothetical protein
LYWDVAALLVSSAFRINWVKAILAKLVGVKDNEAVSMSKLSELFAVMLKL